jgi:hypothetical protein
MSEDIDDLILKSVQAEFELEKCQNAKDNEGFTKSLKSLLSIYRKIREYYIKDYLGRNKND